MKIGLNDPKNKSIVMSQAEFSSDELDNATSKQAPAPKMKRKKTKKRNAKFSQTRPLNQMSNIQTSIIDEEHHDDGDENNQMNAAKKKGLQHQDLN